MTYQTSIQSIDKTIQQNGAPWNAIDGESVARMRQQNRFPTGLDIARYTAKIMRQDMEAYDADPAAYTQSLGCWHGFIAQQKMISIKKHFGSTKQRYLYLSGWMVAALRSEFGPLPDQVLKLVGVMKIKKMGSSFGLDKIVIKKNKVKFIYFNNTNKSSLEQESFVYILNYLNKFGFKTSVIEKKIN